MATNVVIDFISLCCSPESVICHLHSCMVAGTYFEVANAVIDDRPGETHCSLSIFGAAVTGETGPDHYREDNVFCEA